MWEPGFWTMSDTEALAFRTYLQKGGFAVFEDFDGREQWANFEEQMTRVLPGARWIAPLPSGPGHGSTGSHLPLASAS